MNIETNLTERQQRELKYHVDFADENSSRLAEPFCFDVVEDGPRRWWNQYWAMYTYLLDKNLKGKNVLVVGCGFGEDALNLAKAGAHVEAFDLSPESLRIAQQQATEEGLSINFRQMAAEKLDYPDNSFDIVVARDILHHVEIPLAGAEIKRVARDGAILCINEVYSHSFTHRIRYSKFVDQWLYPRMVSFIYRGKNPYITEDEEKLTEHDVKVLKDSLQEIDMHKYFNAVVTRVIPERFVILSKIDRLLLKLTSPFAGVLGSRVLLGGVIKK